MPPPFALFFFNDTATTEIYTLSLHDALPISHKLQDGTDYYGINPLGYVPFLVLDDGDTLHEGDRKSTRLNSSHSQISYAVFCLKKKKKINNIPPQRNARVDSSHHHSSLWHTL